MNPSTTIVARSLIALWTVSSLCQAEYTVDDFNEIGVTAVNPYVRYWLATGVDRLEIKRRGDRNFDYDSTPGGRSISLAESSGSGVVFEMEEYITAYGSRPHGQQELRLGVDYDWAIAPGLHLDASSGGVNDTLYVAFNSLQVNHPIYWVRAFVASDDDLGVSRSHALWEASPPSSEGPVTFAFPMEDFISVRGNFTNEPPNLSKVLEVFVDVWVVSDPATGGVLPLDLGLRVEYDRIWFGSSIPEPGAAMLALLAIVSASVRRRR